MPPLSASTRSRARESSAAIQRLYIAMRHLFIRGNYKPLGTSGEAIIEALQTLRPEIYGSITDPERVELKGLHYIFQRLPQGIEQCRYIQLISKEGYDESFDPIIPAKRRRNCYRIDLETMLIEMTRGRSDIYDVLTHLTFMYIESEKIRSNSTDSKGKTKREWTLLKEIVEREQEGKEVNHERAYTYLSTILGRTYAETAKACRDFQNTPKVNSLYRLVYWLGQRSMEEYSEKIDREITFSSSLRDKIGHHIYGERWAENIKSYLFEKGLLHRPIHIISANLHSVMNILYAPGALGNVTPSEEALEELALALSEQEILREEVEGHAQNNGLHYLADDSGTNIPVQIIDLEKINPENVGPFLNWDAQKITAKKPILFVMDYAFGEQAFETLDELLKPHENAGNSYPIQVESISIMGKAGILRGGKGDIMIPTAHVFEGLADNYPIDNAFKLEDFEGHELNVYAGSMITVLGTSLQNKEILKFFKESSWNAIGLEMEGAHYQKAIQAASRIRGNIKSDVTLRYAYYASDNPLISGQTLASGSLGRDGVKPTYLITLNILNQILS